MHQKSFAYRIFLLNFGLLIVPVLLYFLLFFRWEYEAKIENVLFELHDIGNSRAALLSETVAFDLTSLNLLDEFLDLEEKPETSTALISAALEKIKESGRYKAVSYYSNIKKDDYVALSSTDPMIIGEDFTFRSYVQYAVKYGKSVHLAYGGPPHQWPLLFVAKAIYHLQDKVPMGVFVCATSVQDYLAKLIDTRQISASVRFSLLTEDDIVFVSSDENFQRTALKPISKERIDTVKKDKQFGSYAISYKNVAFVPIHDAPDSYEWEEEGQKRIGVKLPIPGTSMTLLLDEPKSAVVTVLYEDIGKLTLFFIIIITIVALLNLMVIKRLSEPLNKLFYAMDRIGKGDYKSRYVNDSMGYEINAIGHHLNEMTDHIVHYIDSVKEERIRKDIIAKELGIGREIQLSILPQEMPLVEGTELVGKTLPAQEVGGDFFDAYVSSKKERLIVTIGDASGKGISACLYSFVLRSILRSFGFEYLDLGYVLKLANNLFCIDTAKTSNFVTLAAISYDAKTKKLDYCIAGHPAIIVIKQDKSVCKLYQKGVALGVMPLDYIEKAETELSYGDLVFMYTDGVYESMNEDDLIQWLIEHLSMPLADLEKTFLEVIQSNPSQKDDVTYVFMRIK